MIPNQWYIVLEGRQLARTPVGVTRMGEKLVFWRNADGQAVCLRDRCVHRGAQLSIGTLVDHHLQCPFHGLEFDATGRVTCIPANGRHAPVPEGFRVHRYPTYEANGFVWIWWGEQEAPAAPPRYFDNLDDGMPYGRFQSHWTAHYSRAVENQLDVAHLPFVHYNTIGRGGQSLVDGPGLTWDGEDKFLVHLYNRKDDGSTPRKPTDLPPPDPHRPHLEFIFPNLWQLYIAPQMRIVVAFVPVDNVNTIFYVRSYNAFVRVPVLQQLATWFTVQYSKKIVRQDQRVVITQEPRISGLRIGEHLFQADGPILAYRRKRQELLEAGGIQEFLGEPVELA